MSARYLYIIFIVFIVSIILSANVNATTPEILHQANTLYEKGSYAEAIDLYKSAINSGTINGDIYYNIGNSYYRLSKIGEAIFYYKLALRYNPENGDIKFNLNWAQAKAIDKIQDQNIFSIEKISNYLPLNSKDSFYLLAIFSLLFWGILIYSLFREHKGEHRGEHKRSELIKWVKILSFTFFILFVLISSIKFLNNGRDFGVITNKEASVYSASGKDNVVLFTLHEGAEFEINDKLEDWFQIKLNDGKRGWIKSKDSISTIIINTIKN
ncbi:MAG: tetratricopeptide repeat protein [Oligoflexia bacterium]|nr:tetratricopeptide repeat protein [Oligoflexia bacterium]